MLLVLFSNLLEESPAVELKSNVPPGPLDQKWSEHKLHMKLVNPANKRKFSVIVVGSGAGWLVRRRDAGRTWL